MSNITQFNQDKQVQVSEDQLRRLLEFVTFAKIKFSELDELACVIREKAGNHTSIQTLAGIAITIACDCRDECMSEFDHFKESSSDLVSLFEMELAA